MTAPMVDPQTLPLWLTVEEAAAVARIGRDAAYRAVHAGEMPAVRFGRNIRVPRDAFLQRLGAWMPRPEPQPAPAPEPKPRRPRYRIVRVHERRRAS